MNPDGGLPPKSTTQLRKPLCGLAHVRGTENRSNGGNAGGTCLVARFGVPRIDPAQGNNREAEPRTGLPQPVQAQRGDQPLFRGGGKHRRKDQVIGPCVHRGLGFFERVAGNPDRATRPHRRPRRLDWERGPSEVNGIGLDRQGDIGAVGNDQRRVVRSRQRAHGLGERIELSRGQVFFAQPDGCCAAVEGLADAPHPVGSRGAAVGDGHKSKERRIHELNGQSGLGGPSGPCG